LNHLQKLALLPTANSACYDAPAAQPHQISSSPDACKSMVIHMR